MKANCLACGHNVVIDDDAYADYEGQVKCFGCGAILEIKTEEGKFKSVKFVEMVARPSAEEAFERTH